MIYMVHYADFQLELLLTSFICAFYTMNKERDGFNIKYYSLRSDLIFICYLCLGFVGTDLDS